MNDGLILPNFLTLLLEEENITKFVRMSTLGYDNLSVEMWHFEDSVFYLVIRPAQGST